MTSTRILPTKFLIKICLPKSNCEYGTVLIMRFQKYFVPIVLAKPILRKEGRRASGMKKNHSIKPAYCIFAYYTSREQYQSITSLVGGHFGCLDTSKTQFVTKVLMWVKYRTVFLMSSSFHFLKTKWPYLCKNKGNKFEFFLLLEVTLVVLTPPGPNLSQSPVSQLQKSFFDEYLLLLLNWICVKCMPFFHSFWRNLVILSFNCHFGYFLELSTSVLAIFGLRLPDFW